MEKEKIFTEERPWGNFRQFVKNENVTVKIITVKAGNQFSLQYHKGREEFWRILSGNPTVTVGDEERVANVGDEFVVKKEEQHRIRAGDEDTQILEIAMGDFDEEDIVRIEDDYGRIGVE